MSDTAVTLIVILCTGCAIAFIFLMVNKQKKKKEACLKAYCTKHNYSYNKISDPLGTTIEIAGEAFVLQSRMLSNHHSETAGSTAWNKQTTLTMHCPKTERCFTLGSVPTQGNWDALPDWMKAAAVTKLMREAGAVLDCEHPQPVITRSGLHFLLFEKAPNQNRDIIERLRLLLEAWPPNLSLIIHRSQEQATLQITDCFIQDTEMLDKLLRAGAACVA